jgi:hypothetical protein
MDVNKYSTQIERLEVVETGRAAPGLMTRSSGLCWRVGEFAGAASDLVDGTAVWNFALAVDAVA